MYEMFLSSKESLFGVYFEYDLVLLMNIGLGYVRFKVNLD